MSELILWFGLIAAVLTITALASGLVERSPLSFPLIFLGLGFLLGQQNLGLLQIGPHDVVLEVVATLTLSLVLFLDAVKLQVNELGNDWLVPLLVLGPGTGLILAASAASLALLAGFPWTVAFIGGAALASTDPVVLREIVRDRRIPRSIRQILKVEAGVNDIIVLPILLILIAALRAGLGNPSEWAWFLAKLLLLGPAIGFVVGGSGSWMMAKIDARMGIRREQQALYGIGLVLTAYTAATAAGGDGFLGAFAAGLAVVILNQPLCDCFLEYGETTSEVAMLLAFILFGAVLSSTIPLAPIGPALTVAALVIFIIRPLVVSLVLARVRMSWQARIFLSWFGPRGLNSLLLSLLAVQAGVPGAELLLATVGVVVTASVFIHGATATPASAWYGRQAAEETLAEERESSAAGLLGHEETENSRITPEALADLLSSPSPPLVLDVRSRSSYDPAIQVPGSVRVLPDRVSRWASDHQNEDRLIVTYCA